VPDCPGAMQFDRGMSDVCRAEGVWA